MKRYVYDEDEFIPSCTEPIAELADRASADVIAALLEGEGVHSSVCAVSYEAGLPSTFCISVDPRQLHRAKWILRDSDLTDAELTFLATGELGEEPD